MAKKINNASPVSMETRRLAHEKYLAHHQEALDALLNVIRDPLSDHGHRVSAAKEINNRAFGQAPTHATMLLEDSRNEKPMISQDALRALTDEQLTQYAQLTRAILNADENTIEGGATEISSED